MLGAFDGLDLGLEDPEGVDHPGRLIEDGSRKRELLEFPIESKEFDQIPGVRGYETVGALMKDEPVDPTPLLAQHVDCILQIGVAIAISSLSNPAGIV